MVACSSIRFTHVFTPAQRGRLARSARARHQGARLPARRRNRRGPPRPRGLPPRAPGTGVRRAAAGGRQPLGRAGRRHAQRAARRCTGRTGRPLRRTNRQRARQFVAGRRCDLADRPGHTRTAARGAGTGRTRHALGHPDRDGERLRRTTGQLAGAGPGGAPRCRASRPHDCVVRQPACQRPPAANAVRRGRAKEQPGQPGPRRLDSNPLRFPQQHGGPHRSRCHTCAARRCRRRARRQGRGRARHRSVLGMGDRTALRR